ncbi:MAG: DUF5684 domain-containing protein [Actinomycetes bacterium]|jgi:hypothetical protein|nr:DUF5684 domain-containing protein [Actinomycetes bacterium]
MDSSAYDSALSSGAALAGFGCYILFAIIYLVFCWVMLWKLYQKAGRAGWEGIVPIYNYYVMLQIIGRPWWWLILFCIPVVNIVVYFIVSMDLARSFGKESAFGIGLFFLSVIFLAILAFGQAQYVGPCANDAYSGISR